ncbi:cutinase [Colletotrichum phormii]|uniref:Cutinase n=1 Tax=Colletotrichum phormii TaxID=359342 RepID=A0AAI9ZDE9_9PEZI|nr:cutinase [Colletotrichum phormii]KAK1613519.1 cutinase [Colletotrichum phormii]
MFSSLTTRQMAILLAFVGMQSASLVHGLPASDADELMSDLKRTAPDHFDLEDRQDIPDVLAKFPSGPLNQFLRIISTLPADAAALDAVGLILTPLQQGLADSVGIDTTEDDLEQNAACADITVIFARGTTEPGNVGLVTGPPFFDALNQQRGTKSVSIQGVEYPATFAGFNKNGTEGVPSMTNFINEAATNCPSTKIVMSGYSQGALVVRMCTAHRSTANSLPAATMAKINSVLTFGDPGNPGAITGAEGKTKIICHDNDAVYGGGFITVDHLTYAEDADAAAQFVLQMANA